MVFLSIKLEHDDGVVRARSWLKGQVIASPCSIEENAVLGELELDLVGVESTLTATYPNTLNSLQMMHPPVDPISFRIPLKTRDVVFHSERKVLRDSNKPSTQVMEGASFPFSIFLPAHLPPTMEFEDQETRGSCAIQYQLTATAVFSILQDNDSATNADATVRLETLKTHRDLYVVGEPMSSLKYPHVTQPSCFHLKQSLRRHGHITMTAGVENVNVSKGGYVYLTLAIVNKSQHSIDSIEVSMMERLQWRNFTEIEGSPSRSDGRFQTACEKVLRTYTNWFPHGLQAECERGAIGFKDTMPSQEELYKVDELLHEEKNRTMVHVPRTSRVSYLGQLVAISHYIQVVLVLKGVSCQSYPELTIPITVFDSPIQRVCSSHSSLPNVVDIAMNVAS